MITEALVLELALRRIDIRWRRRLPSTTRHVPAAVDRAGLPVIDALGNGIRWHHELSGYFLDEPATNGYPEGVINHPQINQAPCYNKNFSHQA